MVGTGPSLTSYQRSDGGSDDDDCCVSARTMEDRCYYSDVMRCCQCSMKHDNDCAAGSRSSKCDDGSTEVGAREERPVGHMGESCPFQSPRRYRWCKEWEEEHRGLLIFGNACRKSQNIT